MLALALGLGLGLGFRNSLPYLNKAAARSSERWLQVAQDREDEYIFDAQEKAYLLNVQAL